MQDILRDFKSFTSRKLKEEIASNPSESRKEWLIEMMRHAGKKNNNNYDWQLWQQHNHPIELNSNEIMDQKLDYIHMNPVVAGFVREPEHWALSSALDYAGGQGAIKIKFIE